MTGPVDNDATDASGKGPVPGYNSLPYFLMLILFVFLFKSELNLNTCTYLLSLTIVIEILLNILFISGIKILPNAHNYLTIQKPDVSDNYVDRLSVAQFAATIKPNVFLWKQLRPLARTDDSVVDCYGRL